MIVERQFWSDRAEIMNPPEHPSEQSRKAETAKTASAAETQASPHTAGSPPPSNPATARAAAEEQGRQAGDKPIASAQADSAAPASGEQKSAILGDFRILGKLGGGGMGAVFKARQMSLDREVALKVLAKHLATNTAFVERFHREARTLARLDHPNIVRGYAVGEQGGWHYFAMEFVDGTSAQTWMKRLQRFSVGDALHIILACAEALHYAHELNVIHRDIKPANILIHRTGHVKLADMGLAKAITEDPALTESGTGFGTPYYMAPEQARNAKHADHRSDIYALGGTLYYFLTGQLPFPGETLVEITAAKERGRFRPARLANSEVSPQLDLIINRMLAKDPQYRYQNYADLISDLLSLNLASPKLQLLQRAEPPSVSPAAPAPGTTAPTVPASSIAARQAADIDKEWWYLRTPASQGRWRIQKVTTRRLHELIKNQRLDASTKVSRTPQGEFLPPGHFPEFEETLRDRPIPQAVDHKATLSQKRFLTTSLQRWIGRLKEPSARIQGGFVVLVLAEVIFGLALPGWLFLRHGADLPAWTGSYFAALFILGVTQTAVGFIWLILLAVEEEWYCGVLLFLYQLLVALGFVLLKGQGGLWIAALLVVPLMYYVGYGITRWQTAKIPFTMNFLGSVILLLLIGTPERIEARVLASESDCQHNLHQIGLALQKYHDAHGELPAAASHDSEGQPLLSWRVHILPYLGQWRLYKEFHLDEPWDSPSNRNLIARMPAIYRCPALGVMGGGQTTYLAPVGAMTMFPSREPLTLQDAGRALNQTILIVEADAQHAVPWTKPQDLHYDLAQPMAGLANLHKEGFRVLFASGRVDFIPTTVDIDQLRQRFWVLGALAKLGPEDTWAVPMLIEMLQDRTSRIRAIEALGRMGPAAQDAVPALMETLKDTNFQKRAIVVGVLKKIQPPAEAVLPQLIGIFKDRHRSLPLAAEVIANMGPEAKAAVPALIETLGDRDASNRLAAAKALAGIGPEAEPAVPALIEALKDNYLTDGGATHHWLAVALTKIGPSAIPPLITVLQRQSRGSEHAKEALEKFGPEAIPPLFDMLKDTLEEEEDESKIISTVDDVAELVETAGETSSLITHLVEWLQDKDPRLRRGAVTSLWVIGPQAGPAIPSLIAALEDNDAEVRGRAAEVLSEFGPEAKEAIPGLVGLLDDESTFRPMLRGPSISVRSEAAQALFAIDPEALPTHSPIAPQELAPLLLGVMSDPTVPREVRREAHQALAQIGPDAIPALSEALKGENVNNLHRTAVDLLVDIGPEAVPALAEALKSERNPVVRRRAARGLGQMGPQAKAAIPALIDVLKDEDAGGIHAAASQALIDIGPEAVPALERVLKYERTPSIRVRAANMLGAIGPEARDTVPALVRLLKNPRIDDEIRSAAEKALRKIDPEAAAKFITPSPSADQ